jgi:hypothetical protein
VAGRGEKSLGDLGAREVVRFMAAVGPANVLNWLSVQGFGLICAAGLTVDEYAELALYLSLLRVGLDLIAGPSQVNLQVGLGRLKDHSAEDALIVRTSNLLTAATLLAVVACEVVDPHRALGWIGKSEFHSVLLAWLLVSLPMQATSWLDRPVLVHRHRERTDLHMRLLLAAVDSAIALSSHLLGLAGLGVAVVVRYLLARVGVAVWFGAQAPHCRMRQAWPALVFAVVAGVGILSGHDRLVIGLAGGVLAALIVAGEVRQGWSLSSSMPVTPGDR